MFNWSDTAAAVQLCPRCNGHTAALSLGVSSKAHLESQSGANCPPHRPAVWVQCLIGVRQAGTGGGNREEMEWLGGKDGGMGWGGDYRNNWYRITGAFFKSLRDVAVARFTSLRSLLFPLSGRVGLLFFNKSFSIPSPVVPDVWFAQSMRSTSQRGKERANKSKGKDPRSGRG